MDVNDAIKNRRSVRLFTEQHVPDNVIYETLNSALWAPSAGNVQDKEFIVIRDKEVIKKFADACYEQTWVAKAPVLLILLSKLNMVRMKFGERAELYASIGAGMAIENMLLTITGLGLQGTHVGLFDEEEVKRLLKIPDDKKVYSVIALGYSREATVVPKRVELGNITYFDKYGERYLKGKG